MTIDPKDLRDILKRTPEDPNSTAFKTLVLSLWELLSEETMADISWDPGVHHLGGAKYHRGDGTLVDVIMLSTANTVHKDHLSFIIPGETGVKLDHRRFFIPTGKKFMFAPADLHHAIDSDGDVWEKIDGRWYQHDSAEARQEAASGPDHEARSVAQLPSKWGPFHFVSKEVAELFEKHSLTSSFGGEA